MVISAADVGYIVFVLMPGYARMMPGVLAPLLWIVALALTTVAIVKTGAGEQAA